MKFTLIFGLDIQDGVCPHVFWWSQADAPEEQVGDD
jgi:hypothetical protein